MSPGSFLKRFASVFAAFFLVLLLLALFSPRLVKTEWFQKQSLAYISGKFRGQLKWERFKWTLFPAPCLELRGASFERPDQIEARSARITVFPRILPLLRGRIDLGKVVVEAPFIRILLHEKTPVSNPLEKGMAGLHAVLGSGASIHLRNGRITLSGAHGPSFSFEDVKGLIGFSDKETRVSMMGVSGRLGEVSAEGVFNLGAQTAEGKLTLQHFRPHRLLEAFLPETKAHLKDSLARATLHLEADSAGNIALNWEGAVERLVLAAKPQDVELGFPECSGSARVNGSNVSVVLNQLMMDHGAGDISGMIALSKGDPWASVQLVGHEMDVRRVREVTLALFGKDDGVRRVFDVLRAGMVPSVTLKTRGNNLKALTLLSSLTISGDLQEGTIYVRKPELDLQDVSGKAVIQNGLLEASGAKARLGNAAYGRNAVLTFGLDKGDDRFHLDVDMDADVGQFPIYLPRILKNEVWLTELSLMTDLKGRASGKLVLGEDLKRLRVALSVNKFDASATYRRVPFPVHLSGGSVTLTEKNINLSNLTCIIGKSKFMDVSGDLGWDHTPFLDLRSTNAEAVMDEVSPWLQSQPAFSGLFTDVKNMTGILLLSEVVLRGPLMRPWDWQLQMTGRMSHFSSEIAGVSGKIRIRGGTFKFAGADSKGRLSLGGADILYSDGTLHVTGTIDYGLESGAGADLSLKGDLGNGSMKKLALLAGLPPRYVPRGPLVISTARFWRSADGTTRVSGEALLGGEVSVSLECLVSEKRVAVNNLIVRGGKSYAQANINWQDKTLTVVFKGELEQDTFSKLLVPYETGEGRLKGDFTVHVRLDRPLDSSIEGAVNVDDFLVPWGPNRTVKILHCVVIGQKDVITFKSASAVMNDIPFQITGEVWPLAGELFLDLDVSTGRLEWSEVARVFGGDVLKGRQLWDPGPPSLPVRGVIRVRSDSLVYGKRNWVPFKALVTITDRGWTMEVKETNLCGISVPGIVQVTATPPVLEVFPAAQGQSLNPALQCLFGEHMNVTGKFELSGRIEGNPKESPFSKGLTGELAFHARKGRIYRYELLSKIFAFLNLTELLRGKVPDIGKEGFAYNTMKAKAELSSGKLLIKEAIVDAKSMEIGCQGEVDLTDEQLDLRVLVAPLKTIDFIVKHIPGLNYVLGGTLVSFPVRVSGPLLDPTITPLSPTAVGEGLLGIMERALTLPLKIIEPVLPETRK